MPYKLDLHTHSTLSADGGITQDQYQTLIKNQTLDYIAITDHNQINTALALHDRLGQQIIVGEEIMTPEGEVIGLFLGRHIPPHQSLTATLKAIKAQAGLVYIPHPADPRRHGLSFDAIRAHRPLIDLIEIFNARRLPPSSNQKVSAFSKNLQLPGGVGSDAHSFAEIGRTYSLITDAATPENLPRLLATATHYSHPVTFRSFFAPSMNRLRNIFSKSSL
jgi:hypothetical protein